jgi:hypothetical protein
MLAQIKKTQQKKLILFSAQSLPETTSELLEKIGHHQLILYKLLSMELSLPEKKTLVSLKIFLSELRSKLKAFMLTFDEISVQIPSTNHLPFLRKQSASTILPSMISSVTITDIFMATNILYEMFSSLNKHLEKTDFQFFWSDLIHNSLIFYKQTSVVLKGYLRIYKVRSDNR